MVTLLLGAIGGISLEVGGVGVMNVMLVSVSECRREIGIRRALGAKRDDIKGQFLIESTILSIVGGLLGIVTGVGASVVICYFAQWQFVFSPGPILLGVGVSSAVGVSLASTLHGRPRSLTRLWRCGLTSFCAQAF